METFSDYTLRGIEIEKRALKDIKYSIENFNDFFTIANSDIKHGQNILIDLKLKKAIGKEELDIFMKKMYSANKNIISIQVDNVYTVVSDY